MKIQIILNNVREERGDVGVDFHEVTHKVLLSPVLLQLPIVLVVLNYYYENFNKFVDVREEVYGLKI